jgi:hypoxanthine phosphoribosyltransferase
MSSKEIQIHDKSFRTFISESEILASVNKLASTLEKDYEGKDVLLIAILNGAFMFASDIMKSLNRSAEISFVKVSSYKGTQTSGRVDELIGLNNNMENRHIIILEDIVDTGITIDKVISLINANDPASVEVCTLLYKPEAYKGKHKPKYIGFEIPNKFVVGYGLDYNELGRNLKELYQLKEE